MTLRIIPLKSEFLLSSLMQEIYLEISQLDEIKDNSSLQFKLNIPKEEIYISSDAFRIKQILINFISNAIKYTSKGSIELGFKERQKEHSIEFYVEDTGVGIGKEYLEVIFDRFRRIDDNENISVNPKGTGLGLSISKSLVELLGGTIGVKSEQKKGSNFYFIIPRN